VDRPVLPCQVKICRATLKPNEPRDVTAHASTSDDLKACAAAFSDARLDG
jgi:hypothetical protein